MKKWWKDFSIPSGSAVLVDRDGTLNVNKNNGYITSPEELVLLPGVPEGIARLNQIGVPVIMLTNQSAIGRGLMTEDGLNEIHAKLAELLRKKAETVRREKDVKAEAKVRGIAKRFYYQAVVLNDEKTRTSCSTYR